MRLVRLQVEEGFLDGLDVAFSEGLNVLIGPRGTGKTSVIELIRFCLARPAYNEQIGREANLQAVSLLRSGRVILTLESASGDMITVSRSVDDKEPRVSPPLPIQLPILLSQNEIERLGIDASGRLALLDDFRTQDPAEAALSELNSSIRSMTTELGGLSKEILDLHDRIQALVPTDEELRIALERQAESHARIEGLVEQQDELAALGDRLAQAKVRQDALQSSEEVLAGWEKRISRETLPILDGWPTDVAGNDPLGEVRARVAGAQALLTQLVATAQSARELASEIAKTETSLLQELEDRARGLRRELDAAGEGAGEASRLVAEAQEKLGIRRAAEQLLEAKRAQLADLIATRGDLLDQLDTVREQTFRSRADVASKLSQQLGPTIRVEVVRSGLVDVYTNALKEALRGSGLHHGRLAPQIAQSLPPRELVELAEDGNAVTLASILEVEESRARKIIDYITASDTSTLLTLALGDEVRLQLLDGGDYRSTDQLSTGQRCTVILPILLAHVGLSLLVDQPEDNLDNGFIVSAVVEAIRSRKASGQMIFATHNPNIPVLGEAEEVVLMGSDGVRGFVAERGPLDDTPIVDAITRIMEGGREAFERRAAFYRRHPADEPV